MSVQESGTSEVTQLMATLRAQPTPSVVAQVDVLLRLAQLNDPHIEPFLLTVVEDPGAACEVRVNALKWLRNRLRLSTDRQAIAETILRVVRATDSLELRLHAVFTLEDFAEVYSVLTTLGSLVLDTKELIDVRYAAFTSIEHCGPTPECVSLLHQLAADETFGDSAGRLLLRWNVV